MFKSPEVESADAKPLFAANDQRHQPTPTTHAPAVPTRAAAPGGGAGDLRWAASFVDDGGPSDFSSSALHAPRAKSAGEAKMEHSMELGEEASANALDTDLKIIAKKLAASIPSARKAAEELVPLNDEMAELRQQYAKVRQKLQANSQAEIKDEYDQMRQRSTSRDLSKKRDALKLELLQLEDRKMVIIAKARDGVMIRALNAAEGALAAVIQKGKASGMKPGHVLSGADYVRQVAEEMKQLTAQLEMGGNQIDPVSGKPAFGGLPQVALGNMTALEARLNELRDTFKPTFESKPLDGDLENTMDGLELEAASRHLDAAAAQAQALIDNIAFRGTKHTAAVLNDEDTHGVADEEVAAIDSHLAAVQQLLPQLNDEERAGLKLRLNAVKHKVQKIQRTARRGKFAGAAVNALPGRVDEINDSVKAARPAPSAGRK